MSAMGPPQTTEDTYPDTLHVKCNTVGRDAFVVSGFKNVIFPSLVCEATTQSIDIGLKRIRLEKLVGECCE